MAKRNASGEFWQYKSVAVCYVKGNVKVGDEVEVATEKYLGNLKWTRDKIWYGRVTKVIPSNGHSTVCYYEPIDVELPEYEKRERN